MGSQSNTALEPFATDEARWRAVLARDPSADGHFVYAVTTTGVYCRPSAFARHPLRAHVEFFDTAQDAEAAGYRPSLRRQGDQSAVTQARAELVAACCRRLDEAQQHVTLKTLAAEMKLSPAHLHKLFKAETGLTPRAYAAAARARRVRQELTDNTNTVTDAIYGAGFGSSSRFYEASQQLLGMHARDYRAGAPGITIRFAVGQCSLGAILVAQSVKGICAILLGDDPEQLVKDLQDQFAQADLIGADAEFEQLVAQVVGLIEDPSLGTALPLDLRGTVFQERVWTALREIPPGVTLSYTELAQRIGSPKAIRAVAQACGANSIAVAIPCHRIVRQNGDISGYRWGVDRKRELLRRERQP